MNTMSKKWSSIQISTKMLDFSYVTGIMYTLQDVSNGLFLESTSTTCMCVFVLSTAYVSTAKVCIACY